MNIVCLQFGTASLDSSGIGPIIVTNPNLDISDTALVATPTTNVSLSFYPIDTSLYAIASTIPETTNFNYLIVSSR